MLTYKKCTEDDVPDLYGAFSAAFADYLVPLRMDEQTFRLHMLKKDGNRAENSFLALDDGEPVGLILGGAREYGGMQTMRCGGLGVLPAYRGGGVSDRLLELHVREARSLGCEQLVLEVIRGNGRAETFYRKHGYRPCKAIRYYAGPAPSPRALPAGLDCRPADRASLLRAARSMEAFSSDWQSESNYADTVSPCGSILGAYQKDRLVGLAGVDPAGTVYFLWTEPAQRRRGVASALLARAAENGAHARLRMTVLDERTERFAVQMQLEKQALEQTLMTVRL